MTELMLNTVSDTANACAEESQIEVVQELTQAKTPDSVRLLAIGQSVLSKKCFKHWIKVGPIFKSEVTNKLVAKEDWDKTNPVRKLLLSNFVINSCFRTLKGTEQRGTIIKACLDEKCIEFACQPPVVVQDLATRLMGIASKS